MQITNLGVKIIGSKIHIFWPEKTERFSRGKLHTSLGEQLPFPAFVSPATGKDPCSRGLAAYSTTETF